jgi:hypothetical protein
MGSGYPAVPSNEVFTPSVPPDNSGDYGETRHTAIDAYASDKETPIVQPPTAQQTQQPPSFGGGVGVLGGSGIFDPSALDRSIERLGSVGAPRGVPTPGQQLAPVGADLSGFDVEKGVDRERLISLYEHLNSPKLQSNVNAVNKRQEISLMLKADSEKRQAADELALKQQYSKDIERQQKLADFERQQQQEKVSSQMDDMNRIVEDIRNTKIDPGKKIRDNFGSVIAIGISQALASYLFAKEGRPQPDKTASLIEGIINRDIQQQEAAIESKKTALQSKTNILSQMRQQFGDKMVGMEAAKIAMRESFIAKLDEMSTQWKGTEKGDSARLLKDQLASTQAQAMLNLGMEFKKMDMEGTYKSGQLAATRQDMNARISALLAPKPKPSLPPGEFKPMAQAATIVKMLNRIDKIAKAANSKNMQVIRSFLPNVGSVAEAEDQLNIMVKNYKIMLSKASGEVGALSVFDIKEAGERMPSNYSTWATNKFKIDELKRLIAGGFVEHAEMLSDLYDIGGKATSAVSDAKELLSGLDYEETAPATSREK